MELNWSSRVFVIFVVLAITKGVPAEEILICPTTTTRTVIDCNDKTIHIDSAQALYESGTCSGSYEPRCATKQNEVFDSCHGNTRCNLVAALREKDLDECPNSSKSNTLHVKYSCKSGNVTRFILGGVIAAVAVILVILVVAICWLRRKKKRNSDGENTAAEKKDDADTLSVASSGFSSTGDAENGGITSRELYQNVPAGATPGGPVRSYTNTSVGDKQNRESREYVNTASWGQSIKKKPDEKREENKNPAPDDNTDSTNNDQKYAIYENHAAVDEEKNNNTEEPVYQNSFSHPGERYEDYENVEGIMPQRPESEVYQNV